MSPRLSLSPTLNLGVLAGILFGAALFTSPANTSATTLPVIPGSATIQTAVAAAAVGDTLVLAPGIYALDNPVTLKKAITILSQAGPEVTIVDLQYNFGSVFYVYPMATGPTIQGLTIKRGLAAGTGAGAGVYADQASPVIINNLFCGNLAGNNEGKGGLGAAIAVFDGNPIIQRNTLIGNESGGGALFLSLCGGTVDHNVIAYNTDGHIGSSDGFGLSCILSATHIRDNILWANLPAQIDPQCSIATVSNGNITLDPQFCSPAPWPKSVDADWHLQTSSPLAPGQPYFGWGVAYGTCSSTPAQPRSWGQVKALYR